MLRAASGQAGITSRGRPPPSTANRPRLKAIESNIRSLAGRVPPSASARSRFVVRTVSGKLAAAPLRITLTVRAVRLHRSVSSTPSEDWNTASLPPAIGRQLQTPAATGTARQSITAGTCGAAICTAAAIHNMIIEFSFPACPPWPGAHRVRRARHRPQLRSRGSPPAVSFLDPQ